MRGKKAAPVARWAVVVRLPDGSTLYYFPSGKADSRGVVVESWGRVTQAHAFTSEAAAREVAATFQTNSDAKEYLVVRLPDARR